MLKFFSICLVLVAGFSVESNAQDIKTNEQELIEKITKKMAIDGFSEMIPLDNPTQTFDARPGKKYRVVFACNASSKEARRFIAYELNKDGSHKKSFTPKTSKGYRDGGAQIFTLNLPVVPANETAVTIKVDTKPKGKVYIFTN